VSFTDDRAAEIDAYLERAWEKVRWGRRHSPAFEVARQLLAFRKLGWRPDFDPLEDFGRDPKRRFLIRLAMVLLAAGITGSRKLGAVVNALRAYESEVRRKDPAQANILMAYTQCAYESFPPTFAEWRRQFIHRFGTRSLRSETSVRKTLGILDLPLSEGVVGRPRGSRARVLSLSEGVVDRSRSSSARIIRNRSRRDE